MRYGDVVIPRTPEPPVVQPGAQALIAAQTQSRPPGRHRLAHSAPMRLRWRLYGRIDRLQRQLPPDTQDEVGAALAWAAQRVGTLPDTHLSWLDALLDQPALAGVALASWRHRDVLPTHGSRLEQVWRHWTWAARLAGLARGEAPLGAATVRRRVCAGLPARLFAGGWPAWLDVLTLHGLRHWEAPGLTLLDRARLVDVLWSCCTVPPPPPAWQGAHGLQPGVRTPIPGLAEVWSWLEVFDLDPVLELQHARRAGTDDRDIPALDVTVWRDLLQQASELLPGPRPVWRGSGRPTVLGWHDRVSDLYREQTADRFRAQEIRDAERDERKRREWEEALGIPRGIEWVQGAGDRQRPLREDGSAPPLPRDFRADPGYAALSGPFLHVSVEPVWTPDELQDIAAQMHNCATYYGGALASGKEVFLVGRDPAGRAQLLCQFDRPARAPAWGEPVPPLDPATLRLREVKWAYNRRLDDQEHAAWIRWLADRGVPG